MKKLLIPFLLFSFLLLPVRQAEAKWWIFGQSQDEVIVKYLLLNNVTFDEGGPSVTFTRDQLPNGMVYVKGRATAGKASIGSVQVSINNKQKWDKAKVSKDGTFEYTFVPETDKTYDVCVKIIDTRGKTNDLERASKKVTVTEINIHDLARKTLDDMVAAYCRKDLRVFMSFVSADFAGDSSIVERAVSHDFSAFNAISLRYTLNNVTRNAKGSVSVSLTFSRQVTSIKSGQTLSDSGMTEFTFVLDGKALKVYSMKLPVIFGVSDADSIATGRVNTAESTFITVDHSGSVTMGGSSAGGSFGINSGTLSYNNSSLPLWSQSLLFSDDSINSEPFAWGSGPTSSAMTGDFSVYGDSHHIKTRSNVGVRSGGAGNLSDVTSVPTTGYSPDTTGALTATAGNIYYFQMPGGKYAAVQIISAGNPTTFRYKYSASGPDF